MYRNILANYQSAKGMIAEDAFFNDDQKKNKIAQIDIMQVCAFYFLTTTFGDVPYSEAFDDNNVFPKYDDAKTVYNDLIKRLKDDVAALNPGEEGITAAQDVIYGGDVA